MWRDELLIIYDDPHILNIQPIGMKIMKLSAHLQRFAETNYTELIINPELSIQDQYVFTANRFLSELNNLSHRHDVQIEIINVDYDKQSGIPTFILVTNPGPETQRVNFTDELEDIFDKYQLEFIATYIKSYFAA